MKYLSRFDIEAIAQRVIASYSKLPELHGKPISRVDPELLVTNLLQLKIGYAHLSMDGRTMGLTSFQELGIEVYDDADNEFMYILDGRTILIEKNLKCNVSSRGRCNFSIMHESAHQIFKMLFPMDYGVPADNKNPVRFYKVDTERQNIISDWVEWQANVLAAALLLPPDVVRYGMYLFGLGEKLEVLNKIYRRKEYESFSDLADFLGVSKKTLALRMKYLGLLEKDYLDNPFDMLEIGWEDVV